MAEINLTPAIVIWAVFAIGTLGLALYRKLISAGEEDLIHLGPGEERQIPQQVSLASRLQRVDRWGKIMTVVTVLYGLAVAGVYLYQAFLSHQ
ncbi:MAG TPA: hypothetical protein VFW44_02790 [Bryobacteraceae bacterium]|nr:hypothetical protein [Bryobacteraceae bacterium]